MMDWTSKIEKKNNRKILTCASSAFSRKFDPFRGITVHAYVI